MSKPMVIVGAGLAGDSAAAELRQTGWTGPIIMVGDEAERPYDRPPLSKGVLLDPDTEDQAFLRPAEWYAEQGIEMVLGDACVRIDPAAHTIELGSGRTIEYSKLLLATGTRARRLPSLETGMFRVHYLRSLSDARGLREELANGTRLAVIGGGVIGLEVAASARQSGCTVTVVEGLDRVMARCVSPSMSDFLFEKHQANGVDVRLNARLSASQNRPGHLLFEDGSALAVDAVVVGVGAVPNSELAESAGIQVSNGILVDSRTRTSAPDVHAAGDVAALADGDACHRSEHWRHAIDHACAAARVMTGSDETYVEESWLWTDQYDLNIQITGSVAGDSEVARGTPGDRGFIIFHLRDGAVIGATSVNRAKFKRQIAALVNARARIDPAALADEGADLKTLARSAEARTPANAPA